jgi:HD-like signal output (HDOD) protein/tRNA A-37 threonylcarbamoyl transferase component Bud32
MMPFRGGAEQPMFRPMDRHPSRGTDPTAAAGAPDGTAGSALIGATLGNYKVASLLGQGGMGSVYLAEHTLIGRQVAIKVLDPQVAGHPDIVSRFFVEARAVNEIRHPNIVEVTDLGLHTGHPYIVMEYLRGETLESRLARGRLSEVETVRIARQVASALGAAHERGMVHRDLKPANIMLTDHPDYPDFVKVLDFGIAKLLGAAQTPAGHHTEVGTLLGTPAFMSPEQCLGDLQLDHRSDIYSLGVILFLMLAGRLPFQDEAIGRLILAHVHQPAPPLSLIAPQISPALATLVARTLAKNPADRPPTMHALRAALDSNREDAGPGKDGGRDEVKTPRQVVPPAPSGVHRGDAYVPDEVRAARQPGTRLFGVGERASGAGGGVTPLPAAGSAVHALAGRVAEALAERLGRGQLDLPPVPPSISRALQVLSDPGFSYGTLAALLKQEGRLGSYIVRRSNNDGPPGRGVAVTPEHAIPRLGLHGLRTAVIEFAARRVIDGRDERLEEEVRRPWHHALGGAIVAERIARLRSLGEEASIAILAALMRDLGVPLVATLVFQLEFELGGHRSVRSLRPEVWLPMLRTHQRRAGILLVRHWGLPDELASALAESTEVRPPRLTMANLACVAGALADREGFYLRHEYLSESESVADAGPRALGIPELQIRRAVERLKEAVRLRE